MQPPILPDWLLNLIAGLIGGTVRAVSKPAETWGERVVTAFVGGAVAVYLTPVVAPLVQPYIGETGATDAAAGFCGFLLGMSGLSSAEFAIRVIRRRLNIPPKPDNDV